LLALQFGPPSLARGGGMIHAVFLGAARNARLETAKGSLPTQSTRSTRVFRSRRSAPFWGTRRETTLAGRRSPAHCISTPAQEGTDIRPPGGTRRGRRTKW